MFHATLMSSGFSKISRKENASNCKRSLVRITRTREKKPFPWFDAAMKQTNVDNHDSYNCVFSIYPWLVCSEALSITCDLFVVKL